ncbi:MAG: 23S rRNA (guanosine(2251)-2'-O)-methyltransferase RlmB [Chloroflexota bacterium]|nr:MAG: 23S rRNA (guanosine(2251)-2'-O)-methyltransferase RlmB [Chloroflexota bacterium]
MPIIWGRRVVTEALRSQRGVRRVMFGAAPTTDAALADIERIARSDRVQVQVLERRALDRIANTDHHQNVIAEVVEFKYASIDDIIAVSAERNEPSLIVALDHVQDPRNFGTLIRTAEAVGAHGVIIPRDRAVAVTPGVEKASSGAIEHIAIAEVTNLNRCLDDLKKQGVWIVGLDAEGSDRLETIAADGPLCLVVGAEGTGLSRLAREKCDLLIRLPTIGKVASLNAAVAGSIALYDIYRRRARADGTITLDAGVAQG